MKQKNVILMVVAVGCGLVAAFLTTQINAKPKIEMVKVLVAAKNLPVGTMFTKADIATLTTWKDVPKESLPPQFVGTEEELLEKKLSQSLQKDETFNPVKLTKGGVVTLPEGKDMISLKMTPVDAAAGFIGPGSKVDILATLNLNGTYESFPLLIDMAVMTVNAHTDYANQKGGVFSDVNMVSLAVDQEEALLIKLAEQRSCHLSLLLRREGKPHDPNYDMKKIKKLLESEKNPIKLVGTEGPGGKGAAGEASVPPVVTPEPTPTPKPEMVKVLVASEDIAANTDISKELIEKKFVEKDFPKEFAEAAVTDASPYFGKVLKTDVAKGQLLTATVMGTLTPAPKPEIIKPETIKVLVAQEDIPANTDVTKDLIAKKFVEKDFPKDFAEGAVGDATSFYGQVLRNGVTKGQLLTLTLMGLKPSKPAPLDTDILGKPAPAVKVAKAIRDITVHTTSGSTIWRYEEQKPGEWKLIKKMTFEEAARQAKNTIAATPDKQSGPEKQPATPDAGKFE